MEKRSSGPRLGSLDRGRGDGTLTAVPPAEEPHYWGWSSVTWTSFSVFVSDGQTACMNEYGTLHNMTYMPYLSLAAPLLVCRRGIEFLVQAGIGYKRRCRWMKMDVEKEERDGKWKAFSK